ncbi:MAG: hypothetical protein ACLFTK_15430 [Anaerolineales bacterium]
MMTQSSSPHIRQLTPGLTHEALDDTRVHVFTLTNMTRETVDAWVDGCIAVMRACHHAGRPVAILQDLSDPTVGQTPYSKQRGEEATHAFQDVHGRIAFLLPHSVHAAGVRRFLRSQSTHARQREAFHTRETALAWLREVFNEVPGDLQDIEPHDE